MCIAARAAALRGESVTPEWTEILHSAWGARRRRVRCDRMASVGKIWLTVGILASALGLSIKRFAGTSTTRSSMPPTFAELRLKHETVSLVGKEAIVVGGTSGIGMGIALRLAEAGAAVTIVGRDRTRAARIVEQMNAAPGGTAAPQHSFKECNCFLLSNVATCAAELAAESSSHKLDFLVLTQGMATTQGHTPTAEGLDEKLALHYYSRVAFAKALAPLLESATPGGRVLSVLSAGVHGTYQGWRDDTAISAANYSLKNAADGAGFYNDLAVDSLSREHPTLSFTHAAPGFVNTNWGTELNVVLRGLVRCLQPLGMSPATCAEFMCANLFDPDSATGFYLMTASAEVAAPRPEHEQAREIVWAHTMDVLATLALKAADAERNQSVEVGA